MKTMSLNLCVQLSNSKILSCPHLEVTIDLNLNQAQATAYYGEYLKLVGLDDITEIYLEFQGNTTYFVKLCKEAKAAKIGIPQVVNLLRIANLDI